MKTNKTIYIAAALMLTAAGVGCNTDLPVYDYPHDGVSFADTVSSYSFVYGDPQATRDSFMVKVTTMGHVRDHARRVQFEQELTGKGDAVPGVHYVAFDDPAMESLHVIPAGEANVELPVILLRDGSLLEKEVVLKIRVKENGIFGAGLVGYTYAKITFSDMLTRPRHWNGGSDIYWCGAYGPVKHRWIIELTGEKWDDEYLHDVIGFDADEQWLTNENYDSGYVDYLIGVFKRELELYNQQRKEDNGGVDDPLTEEDGTVVAFP